MRLARIKLAGFKSFVDPTTIHLPSNLVGVVGPNGCGKSNVIDAIRWVMGETSAKHLRGDSMADVIFNGCASRKPVGTATIELVFDNSDGAIGGPYARYSEVSIRRTVARDGTSQYFLNNTRCRRKDITGIFLGTGLGPRSYAIIEQGMVSRLIEARPDEMRVYIEEAAGISKYKERRRETENRIRHTRDNLDRLNDLREEIDNQIQHLQRQARQAERYKELKQQERHQEAELLGIRFADLDRRLTAQKAELSQARTRMESALADQRSVEANIETARQQHIEATDEFNATQGRYYAVQSEISRLEQAIAHSREIKRRQEDDLAQASTALVGITEEITKDRQQLDDLEINLEALRPALDRAREAESESAEALRVAEAELDAWQDQWHQFNLEVKEFQQTQSIERTRIEHLEAQLGRLRERSTELDEEQRGISITGIEETLADQTRREQQAAEDLQARRDELARVDAEVEACKTSEQSSGDEVEQLRAELESRRARVETLEAVQSAALADEAEGAERWLARNKLGEHPRLAQALTVEEPWAPAVETVLGDFLQAVCVAGIDKHLRNLPNAQVTLVEHGADTKSAGDGYLLGKVKGAGSAAHLLAGIRTAESLAQAIAMRSRLGSGESVITSDGVWLGSGWVRVARGAAGSVGLISREQDIRALHEEIVDYEARLRRAIDARSDDRQSLVRLDRQRAEILAAISEADRQQAAAATLLDTMRQEFARARDRLTNLSRGGQSVRDEIDHLEQGLREAQARLTQATEAAEEAEKQRPGLEQQQQDLLERYNTAREQSDQDRAAVAQLNIDYESRRASRESASTTLSRVTQQHEQLNVRVATLSSQIDDGESPIVRLQADLEAQLEHEVAADAELGKQRRALEEAETRLRDAEAQRAERERRVGEQREVVDAMRMAVREIEVRREGLDEQFAATGQDLSEILAGLPDEADVETWEESLQRMRRRIERLGAINLAAIDEFTEQSERKKYLDAQFEDLTDALETLERAIRKIDRETRARFQDTFEKVNEGLKRIFPRLFGGGHAYLNLDGDDLLSAGVTVMARPPGKRNSTIHLLSGGEKALTAVALIFAIFELNPAPFCLLDEVDAPLDDANVGRFCEIVREMSATVQFIIITHNKMTMEMARQLTGVTMQEPGVSRLVSVDIDEAVQLAVS